MTELDSALLRSEDLYLPDMLVLHRSLNVLGRIVEFNKYTHVITVRRIHDSCNGYCRPEQLQIVSGLPPYRKGESTIAERRAGLMRNLDDAIRLANTSRGVSLLHRLHRLLACGSNTPHRWQMWTVAEAVADARQFSWATRMEDVDNDARRRRGRPSTFLQWAVKQSYESFTREEIRVLAELIGNTFIAQDSFTFDIVRDEEILYAYNHANDPDTCMSGKDFVLFYADNPEKVALVRIFQDDEYMGRALLWTTDDGDTLLDRIYPDNGGLHQRALRAYALTQGWTDVWLSERVRADGEPHRVTMVNKREEWPYLDSFRFLTRVRGKDDVFQLWTREPKGKNYWKLESTQGGVYDDDDNEMEGDLESYVERGDDYYDDDGY